MATPEGNAQLSSGGDDSSAGFSDASTERVTSLPSAAVDLANRMFDAARNNDVPLLTSALTAGLPPNLTNAKGDTLLMLASYHGHLELTYLLLARGADPNVLNERGQSPLAGTVFKGEREVADALLRGGADPDLGEPSARGAVKIFGVDRLVKDGEEGWGAMMTRLANKKDEGQNNERDTRERNDVEGKVTYK